MRFGRTARRHRAGRDGSSAALWAGAPAVAEALPRTVDLRVLLVTSGDDEPSTQAWQALLESEGVPFERLVAGIDPLTSATLESGPRHGRYQAVILATDSLVRLRDGVYGSSLDAEEWVTLRDYLRVYRVRQISAYATPGPTVGLQSASWAGDLGDAVGRLTDAGRVIFSDLVGDVPLSPGTYGYLTAVADGVDFTTLVSGHQDSPMVGVFAHPDGRQELVVTVASGPFSRHMHLLGHGMLAWATRGRHLGHHGYYMSTQVDDVLLGSTVPPGAEPIRMNPDDVRATARWSRQNQMRLDFAFNGWGAVTATMDRAKDPLTECLIEAADEFNWINHTFGHLDLDHATPAQITDEINNNLAWAREHGIDVPADALVTGAHSGLDNPALATVADRCGIRWMASDASRAPDVRPLAGAYLVPRHPVNIPLDVCTRDALLRQRRATAATGVVDTLERSDVLAMEATLILTHLLSNDPRPHYTHQNALVGDRLLLGLLDGVLQSFHALIRTRPVQLTLAEAGQELLRRAAWSRMIGRGAVSARDTEGLIEIVNDSDRSVEVPWSGSGSRGGWVTVPAGRRLVLG
jgi:heparan sulfate-N-deacetylase